MPAGGVGKDGGVRHRDWLGALLQQRDHLGHDKYCLADMGVLGPLHADRGHEDGVQEAAHLVGDGPFVRCKLPRGGNYWADI